MPDRLHSVNSGAEDVLDRSEELVVSIRKFGVLLFGVVSVLLLTWPNLASAADPPAVQSGTAKSNCERITAAGFSPYDYVHVVTRYEEYSIKVVDYFHVFYDHFPPFQPGNQLSLALADSREQGQSGGMQATNQVEGFVVTQQESPHQYLYQYIGALTDGQGNVIQAVNNGKRPGDVDNLNAYTWTPTDGDPVVYRDQSVTATYSESEWVYDPNWAGPDGARMSSIWGNTPACVG